jgi:hypothetical protein
MHNRLTGIVKEKLGTKHSLQHKWVLARPLTFAQSSYKSG